MEIGEKAILEDIAVLTGGEVISEEKGMKLEEASIEQLGRAKTVKVTKDLTVIVDGAGSIDDIKAKNKFYKSSNWRNNIWLWQRKIARKTCKVIWWE